MSSLSLRRRAMVYSPPKEERRSTVVYRLARRSRLRYMTRNFPSLYLARKPPIVLRKLDVIPSRARSLLSQGSRKTRLHHFIFLKKILYRLI
jgi:hypothetical protein